MSKKISILIIFLIFFSSIFAQNNKIDSLKNQLSKIDLAKEPQKSLEIINNLYDYTYRSDPQTAIEIVGSAIYICDSLISDTAQKIIWVQKLGDIYLMLEKYDLAMKYFVQMKNYYENKDSVNYAFSLYNLGKVYLGLNVYELALQELQRAKFIFEENKSEKGIVLTNIKLSWLYFNDYDDKKAYQTLYSSLTLSKNDKYLLAQVYNTLGLLYSDDENIDSAVFCLNKAIEFYKTSDEQIEVGECYISLSQLFINNEDFKNAFQYLERAENIFKNNSNNSKLTKINNLYGNIYFLQKEYKKAESYFLKAIQLSEFNIYLSDQKLVAYKSLSEIYTIQKNYQKANEYLLLYSNELQMLFEQKAKQGYAEVILTFQNEEKLRTIKLLEKDADLKSQKLRNQRLQMYGFGIFGIFMIVFAFVLYTYSRKQKQANKLLKEQNRQINLQKKELETQSKILEKATRDLLKQKDELQFKSHKISSSITYASRIQMAMLPNEDLFKKHFRDYFVFYMPKETVSGDFFWISEIKSTKPSLFVNENEQPKVLVAVVDCTGHGVPGAFMAMLGDAYMNQIVNILHIYEPDKILYELHKSIRKALQQQQTENNDGMDIAICMIDKKSKILEFSGAKNPLVYVQNEKLYRINGSLLAVGGLQKEKERIFEKNTIDITAKTTIYLFSDGFQDQFGGKFGRKYMAQPFREFLFSNSNLPASEQKKALVQELTKWKGKKYIQMDDITVLGIEI